jgi:hypothetical protein
MQKSILALFIVATLTPIMVATPARAQIYYPWCANYGGDAGGSSNCGFSTYEQCLATISGMGGSCDRNPFYTAPAERPGKRAHKTRNG